MCWEKKIYILNSIWFICLSLMNHVTNVSLTFRWYYLHCKRDIVLELLSYKVNTLRYDEIPYFISYTLYCSKKFHQITLIEIWTQTSVTINFLTTTSKFNFIKKNHNSPFTDGEQTKMLLYVLVRNTFKPVDKPQIYNLIK